MPSRELSAHQGGKSGQCLVDITKALAAEVDAMQFGAPVVCCYNPLDYAWALHEQYLRRYGQGPREVLFVGMNPGPFGMVQTGVPFGDVGIVRDWFGIEGEVKAPVMVHLKRPVLGFQCKRREVSGSRLWGWAQQRYGSPEAFFTRYFVANYCPLAFVEASGRNRTPDKLAAEERRVLYAACDKALRAIVAHLKPHFIVGIGGFAERRVRDAMPAGDYRIGSVLHPSPASPLANRGWAEAAERQLAALGIKL